MLSNLSYMQLSLINQYIYLHGLKFSQNLRLLPSIPVNPKFYSNSRIDVQDGHFHISLQTDSLRSKDIYEECVSESISISLPYLIAFIFSYTCQEPSSSHPYSASCSRFEEESASMKILYERYRP